MGISSNWTKEYRVYWQFQKKKKNRIPVKRPCRLSKFYLQNVGLFIFIYLFFILIR